MPHRDRIHQMLAGISNEVLAFIRQEEPNYPNRWVPAAHIKNRLDLLLPAVPRNNGNNQQGWLFGVIARKLEDENRIEYARMGHNSFCRSIG